MGLRTLRETLKEALEALTNSPDAFLPATGRAFLSEQEPEETAGSSEMVEQSCYSRWNDTSTGSVANLKLALHWLLSCILDHEECKVSVQPTPTFPTRVIDILNPEKPYLRECVPEQRGPYLALSYCWGLSLNRFTTTSNNYLDHLERIPLELLPRTFREAIHVTSALGFRSLWIDALCIIQDSSQDLQRETGQMGEIYRNATLTISAARGSDVTSGLFVTRDPRYYKPCKLDIKLIATRRVSSAVFVHPAAEEHLSTDWQGEPLYNRGWVLQEEVLSTRALIFGHRQMLWRCIRDDLNEKVPYKAPKAGSVPAGLTAGLKGLDTLEGLRIWLHNPAAVRNSPWRHRYSHFNSWYSMVERYCTRKLTYQTDKLPALSGLANLMSQTHDCTYIAGLWQEDLQSGLAWYVLDWGWNHSPNFRQSRSIKRLLSPSSWSRTSLFRSAMSIGGRKDTDLPEEEAEGKLPYIAPSWSWASAAGSRIHFLRWWSEATQKHEYGVQHLNSHCLQISGSLNPFGEITDGFVELKGRLRPAILRTRHRRTLTRATDRSDYPVPLDPMTGVRIGSVALDEAPPLNSAAKLSIWCLLTLVRKRQDDWQMTGLVLVPTDATRTEYRRIGLLFLSQMDWFGRFGLSDKQTQGNIDTGTEYLTTVRII
jgi:hypothetical protein